jgi:hypothetical protein
MNADLDNVLIAAVVALAGWFVKDFLFGLVKNRNELERREWEYRLKEVYCPLYLWSGLLIMRTDKQARTQICEHLHEVMARAAYVIPKVHYYTLVRLLEMAHGQRTSAVTETERDRMRAYLYGQIEVFTLILYRSEDTGGVGDQSRLLSLSGRRLRLLMVALSHLFVWLLVALSIGGVLWLYQRQHLEVLGLSVVLLLLLLLVDTRRRAEVQRGIAERLRRK